MDEYLDDGLSKNPLMMDPFAAATDEYANRAAELVHRRICAVKIDLTSASVDTRFSSVLGLLLVMKLSLASDGRRDTSRCRGGRRGRGSCIR